MQLAMSASGQHLAARERAQSFSFAAHGLVCTLSLQSPHHWKFSAVNCTSPAKTASSIGFDGEQSLSSNLQRYA
jgi:hypothetical protein